MKHDYSIFLWDVGTAGSYLACLSDFLRYNIPFTEENVKKLAWRKEVQVEINPAVPNNNEYQAGLFYNPELPYWYQYVPGDRDTRDDCLNNIRNNVITNHILCHHIDCRIKQKEKLNEFAQTVFECGYRHLISVQAVTHEPLLLMHYKRMGRMPFKADTVTEFTLDRARQYIYKDTICQKLNIMFFGSTEIFANRDTFNKVISLLSGGYCPTDDMWEHAQHYNSLNNHIISWMNSNYPTYCREYEAYYNQEMNRLGAWSGFP